ncbi:PREDICTED: pro-interleukin-16 [Dipodomys ordii]|uniref:Pro-interleukin-16 n=1 Tax=Dipodomys ordii TaxID=10020 RepID=A0A1S3ETL4_DIPOR|nr:PREDICTED: pro-interleukin-16 [Dipodomys ordii]
MSNSHSRVPRQPGDGLGGEDGTRGHPGEALPTADTANGAPKVHTPADSSGVKRGPPVAPKPAWLHQSLSGLRRRQEVPPAGRPAPTPPPQGTGAPAPATSIKQRISSFENLASSQTPDRAQRLSLHPSSGEAPSPSGKPEDGRPPGLWGPGAPLAATHKQPEQPPQGLPEASPSGDPAVPASPTPARPPGRETRDSGSRPRPLSSEAEDVRGPALKMPSQRARSFPLARTKSCETTAGDGRSGRLYAISSQVSSAVMKSLLCVATPAPGSQATRLPPEGAAPPPAPSQDAPADGPANAAAPDTSFSLNLSELRGYTEGLATPAEARCASQPSQPGPSVIALLSPAELRQLKEEVSALDETSLKKLDSIRVTVLHKEEGVGLGFSLAGGVDLENKVIRVHRVFPGGLASREGTIQKDDEVLSINGKSLKEATHSDALAVLRQARDPRQAVIVTRPAEGPTPDLHGTGSAASQASAEPGATVLTMTLEKTSVGLGFSLEGGRASLLGDRPLTVNRIFKGTTSEQSDTVQLGDEVLRVAGTATQGLTRYEVWSVIKALPEGPVSLVIKRRRPPSKAAVAAEDA